MPEVLEHTIGLMRRRGVEGPLHVAAALPDGRRLHALRIASGAVVTA